MVTHKNGATDILGIYLINSSDEDIVPFSDLTNRPNKNNRITLESGFTIYNDTFENHKMEQYDFYKNNKNSTYKALILGCSDIQRFKDESGIIDEILFDGKKGYRIIQNNDSWDIIVIEK